MNTRITEQKLEKAEKLVRAYDRSRRALGQNIEAVTQQVVVLLNELRKEIKARLLTFIPEDKSQPFDRRILPEIEREIESAVSEYRRRSGPIISAGMAKNFELGAAVTATALGSIEIGVTIPGITPETLVSMTGTFEDVYDEIISDLGERINRVIRRSATGLTSASQAMDDVERILRTSMEVKDGLRKRIKVGLQAEQIVRTELGRVYANAQQIAAEQIATRLAGLKKQWVTTMGRRRGHRETEQRYSPGGEIGPIPVKQRYEVRDYSRTGYTQWMTIGGKVNPPNRSVRGQRVIKVPSYRRSGSLIVDRMLFPRDPAGSAGNIVNCTCNSIEVVSDIEKQINQVKGILKNG